MKRLVPLSLVVVLAAACSEAASPDLMMPADEAASMDAVGQIGDLTPPPARQGMGHDLLTILPQTHVLGPGSIDIVPANIVGVGNCIPFGSNAFYAFTGFIYRNVPAFNLQPGGIIAFDIGAPNDVVIRRDIYFATANINPAPAVVSGNNVVSQGVYATGWTQVVSVAQAPAGGAGNSVVGDWDLRYTAENGFNFPGGGLIIGFAGYPPSTYYDGGCEQVGVLTTSGDPSGNFYSRFFGKPHLTTGVLDNITGGGSAAALQGVIIQATTTITVDLDIKPGSDPNSINLKSKGVIPVAVLSTQTANGDAVDFDATDIDWSTVVFGPGDATEAHGQGHVEDVDGDGDDDMVFHFRTQDSGLSCGDTDATLTGQTNGGQDFEGTDAVNLVKC